jgi:uncharacterized protein
LQARSYDGGEIKVEQDLGTRGNFKSYIISYYSDGLKLRALLNIPTSPKPASGFPTLILNHGFIPPDQYNTITSYQSFGDYFARQGFIVFKPDYRGHAQSEGVGEAGNTAPFYVHDVLNLLASVKKHPEVDRNKIAMLGHSMGGGITLRATEVDKDIKASVLVAGVVASPQQIWELGKRVDDPDVPGYIKTASPVLEAKYGTPLANPEIWAELNPLQYLDAIAEPVQIHHGTNDKDVPKSFSDHLNMLLKDKGHPVEYFEYQGGDHNLAGKDRALFLQRTTDFLRKNLQ